MLLTLGRLFPAFGLLGTLIGLAMVLRSLAGETGLSTVAPTLGVTVLTTLYGAVLAVGITGADDGGEVWAHIVRHAYGPHAGAQLR